jgi:hypothetical protein
VVAKTGSKISGKELFLSLDSPGLIDVRPTVRPNLFVYLTHDGVRIESDDPRALYTGDDAGLCQALGECLVRDNLVAEIPVIIIRRRKYKKPQLVLQPIRVSRFRESVKVQI